MLSGLGKDWDALLVRESLVVALLVRERLWVLLSWLGRDFDCSPC